jgi:membrane protein
MWEKIGQYFTCELWNFPLSQERGWNAFFVKWVRIAYLSTRGFLQDRCSLTAAALTYNTLMAIVPILAMGIAIAGGFGYHKVFKNQLLYYFEEHSSAIIELFKYADIFLEKSQGGLFAGIGFAFLFLTVTFLLMNLETVFNHIWKIKKIRSLSRLFSDYLALMLFTPLFFILASSLSIFIVSYLEGKVALLPLVTWIHSFFLFLVQLIPYCLFWLFFTSLYFFIPNTKVKFSSAWVAGFFIGTLYPLAQWAYIYFQIRVNSYGAVYGSLAALPLFLLWVNLSWLLVLFGAEISYAHQTLEEHEFEEKAYKMSYSFKRLLSLWIVHLNLKKGFITKEMLIKGYQLPFSLAKIILEELVNSSLIHETRGGYVPSHKLEQMKISDVIEALESEGEKDFPFIQAKALAPFEKALEAFRKQIESSPANIGLANVSHSI